ncbi:MAG TPA: TadE/TadG family type IV pilus assembly protein [Acidimicrobiales bacterium]|nr:TadE/TadG family type IV pilus assembly protein [Acidimicrobiales bacterium]
MSRSERGSAPLELALVTVPVLAMVMFIVLAGRIVQTTGTVDGAARAGARAASTARASSDAQAAARAAVDANLADAGLPCEGTDVRIETSDFRAGGTVAVRVTCLLRVSDLGPLPVPGTRTIVSDSVAVVDVYRGAES